MQTTLMTQTTFQTGEAGGSGQHFWWVSPHFLEGCVTHFR